MSDTRHEIRVVPKTPADHGESDLLPEATEFHDQREVAADGVRHGDTVHGSGGSGEGLPRFAELGTGEPSLGKD